MGCITACAQDLPAAAVYACVPEVMKGGIRALAFMKCDASFDDTPSGISSVASWEALVTSGDLVFSGDILGAKPKGSSTSLRTASCSPERVTARVQTITFKDYNADLTSLAHYDFWITIQENFAAYKLLYITCEGYAYGTFENKTWSLDIDDVREETSEAPLYIDGSITITKLLMTKPVLVPGLLDILP